jgi:DNA primase
MYNHPLSFSVYNLNHSKENIQKIKKAIVFESEKSCLKYRSFFGEENDISCAICGSSFIQYQAWLLINQGAKEIVVALDHDFTDLSSEVAQRQIKNLKQIHNKYGKFVTISFLWDKENLLGYKDSPIDKSKEVFLELYKNRINLY